ncbi:hypothetical protein ACJX0J_041866 [Zea mays]
MIHLQIIPAYNMSLILYLTSEYRILNVCVYIRSYYLIIISFIKYHMKVQIIFGHLLLSWLETESILYMVSGTSLYLNSFNNMAIVGVSLGIVIAFCASYQQIDFMLIAFIILSLPWYESHYFSKTKIGIDWATISQSG